MINTKHLLDYHAEVERGQYERTPNSEWLLRCLGKKTIVERLCLYDQAINGAFDYAGMCIKLNESGGIKTQEAPSFKGGCPNCTYTWPDTIVSLKIESKIAGQASGGVSIYSTNHERFLELYQLLRPLVTKVKQQGQVYILIASQDGVVTESLGMANIPLEVDNYRPEAIAGFNQIVSDITAKDPVGRLSIINGIYGSGKTFFIRSIIGCSDDAMFVVLPANMTADLAGPSLISCLTQLKENDKTIVLIIEDADNALSRRASDNISAISTLLNASDGIIGHLINLRIICTTNAEVEDFDPAITRPGRLSANIEIGLLEPDHAARVYKRLTGEDKVFKKCISLAEVYSLAKKGESFKFEEPKRAVGFSYDNLKHGVPVKYPNDEEANE